MASFICLSKSDWSLRLSWALNARIVVLENRKSCLNVVDKPSASIGEPSWHPELLALGERVSQTEFCGLMNMAVPALSKDAFQNNQRTVLTAACTVAQRSLNKAAADLRSVQEEQGCDVPGDCAVTYDCT